MTHTILRQQKIILFIRHIRWAQLSFHIATMLLGSLIAFSVHDTRPFSMEHFIMASVFLGILVVLAWISSAMINDYHDHGIDKISNTKRPLPSGTISPETYKFFSLFLHIIIPLFALFINPIVALFLTAYLAISLAYNTPPLRLKRFPLISTFTIGLALQMIIFAGYALVAPNHILQTYPFSWTEILIALGIFTLIAPIKDFKDIDGDRAHGVMTVPVLFGPRGGRIIVTAGIVLLLMRIAFLTAETPIVAWIKGYGIITALLAIYIIHTSQYNKRIKEHALVSWLIFLVAVATLILFALLSTLS